MRHHRVWIKRNVLRRRESVCVRQTESKPKKLREENLSTMSRRFGYKNQEFLHFNTSHETKIPKRLTSKTVNVTTKSITDQSPKKEKKIATPQDVLNDFLESTSVHGLQYFGKIDIKVGLLGKILWTCAMLTGFVCLSLMVMQFLSRYRENPTNTYIKDFAAPIFKVPFPAVTVCTLTPIPMSKRTAILDNVILPENVSRELAMQFLKYGHRITLPYVTNIFNHTEELEMFLTANKWTLLDFVKILHPCEDIYESCWWHNERIDCNKFIVFSLSSYGICCSFNYVLEQYVGRDKSQPKIIPLSSAGFGPRSGLKLVIRKEVLSYIEDGDADIIRANGVGLLVHHSMEYPGLNTNLYVLERGHNLEVAVSPMLMKTPAGMYHRNAENKLVPLCVPENENTLEYLPIYRYSNCYANCRIKAMIRICGCLPFTFDYLASHHSVNRCNMSGLVCIQSNLQSIAIVKDTRDENFTCFCRTPCNNVMYETLPNAIVQINAADMSIKRNTTVRNAILKVFMEQQTFQILETLPAADEIYLLASIGGIFSLFLGCSFLSLVEVIYFFGLFCRAIVLNRKVRSATLKEHEARNDIKKRYGY